MNYFFLPVFIFLFQKIVSIPINSRILSAAFIGPAILYNGQQNLEHNGHSTEIYSSQRVTQEERPSSNKIFSRSQLLSHYTKHEEIQSGLCEMDLDDYFLAMKSMYSVLTILPDRFQISMGLKKDGHYRLSMGKYRDVLMLGNSESDIQLLLFEDLENEQIGVVIPGSKSINNLYHDFLLNNKIIRGEKKHLAVHFGFWKMFNEIRDSTVNQIKSLLSSQRDKKFKGITIFGHSMGAAVGSLLSRELTKNKIEGLPVNLVTLGIPPLSNPAIPESELADSIYHLYIPGDIVYDLVQFTEFKHPGGRKIPLRGTGIKDIFRHCVSDYHNLYLEMTDTCKLT